MKEYGVTFGPDNSTGVPGKCIAGKGRFLDLHGKNADSGDGAIPFVERMFKSFVKNASHAATIKTTPQMTDDTDPTVQL